MSSSAINTNDTRLIREILRGDSDQDPSVDMWALGILALHLACRNQGLDPSIITALTHRSMPCQSETDALLHRLAKGANAFSKATYDFVHACLRVDPRRRIKAEEAMRHPLLTHNEGVFKALEELRNRGGTPDASPLLEMGRELQDVAPEWRIGMKGIPPARSDSAAQYFGTARAAPSYRGDLFAQEPFGAPAAATMRGNAGSHREGASPYTPRMPADEGQNPFRMSPLVPQAATLRAQQASPTRNPGRSYISPKHTDRTLPIQNPRPKRAPVWSIFNKNAPILNPNPNASPNANLDAGLSPKVEAELPTPQSEKDDQGVSPGNGYVKSFGAEYVRAPAPTDPGPWERDIRGRGTPYPRFHPE